MCVGGGGITHTYYTHKSHILTRSHTGAHTPTQIHTHFKLSSTRTDKRRQIPTRTHTRTRTPHIQTHTTHTYAHTHITRTHAHLTHTHAHATHTHAHVHIHTQSVARAWRMRLCWRGCVRRMLNTLKQITLTLTHSLLTHSHTPSYLQDPQPITLAHTYFHPH